MPFTCAASTPWYFLPSENSKLLSMSFSLSLLAPLSKILPHKVLTGKLVWDILPLSLYFLAPNDLVPSYLLRMLSPQFFSCVCMLTCFSRVWLFAILWTVAYQAPLSTGFPKQEYWSGLPYPPPGDLPDPGIEPASLTSPALAGGFFTTSAPWETLILFLVNSHLSRQSQFKCHHLPEIFLDCQPAINSCFLFAQHLCKMAITIAMLLLVKYLSSLPDSSVHWFKFAKLIEKNKDIF